MIRDPKALAEACVKASGLEWYDEAHAWATVPSCLASVFAVTTLIAKDLRARNLPSVQERIGLIAIGTLATMVMLQNEQWAFRAELQRKPAMIDGADRLLDPIRDNAAHAVFAWSRDDRKDCLIALELLVVACSDFVNTLWRKDLDDLLLPVLVAVDASEETA